MAELAPELRAAGAGRAPFAIADHGGRCCVLARTWLQGLDATFHRGAAHGTVPAWIARRFGGGAAVDELHWCEIPDAAVSDAACAALVRELWSTRCAGICAVQLVDGDLAYREAAGREQDGRLEVWDADRWLRPRAGGPTLGVRVTGGRARVLRWGEQRVPAGQWTAVQIGVPLASPGGRSSR